MIEGRKGGVGIYKKSQGSVRGLGKGFEGEEYLLMFCKPFIPHCRDVSERPSESIWYASFYSLPVRKSIIKTGEIIDQ